MSQRTTGNQGRFVAGAVLVLIGLAQIVSNWISEDLQAWLWIVALAGSAVAFSWVYRRQGEAWALIGAYVTGAIALLVLLLTQFDLAGILVPSLVLAAIAFPFIYAWTRNRKEWGLLVPAYVLLAIIPILFISDGGSDDLLIPAYVMGVIGAPFVVAFLRTQQWPFLIPGGIMWLIGAFFLFDAIEKAGAIIAIILIIIGGLLLFGDRIGLEVPKPKREG